MTAWFPVACLDCALQVDIKEWPTIFTARNFAESGHWLVTCSD